MNANRFLVVGGLVATVCGLVVVGFGLMPQLGAVAFSEALFWPGSGGSGQSFSPASQLIWVVMGGVLAGWGISFTLLARAMLNNERAVATPLVLRALATGVTAWYVLDSGGSALLGAWPNVASNTVFLALLLTPLLLLMARVQAQESLPVSS